MFSKVAAQEGIYLDLLLLLCLDVRSKPRLNVNERTLLPPMCGGNESYFIEATTPHLYILCSVVNAIHH